MPTKMDLFMDLNVLAVGGFQWPALERRVEENFPCDNDLQRFLAVHGIPRIDAVERVMGTAPTTQLVDDKRASHNASTEMDYIVDLFSHIGLAPVEDESA